MPIFEFTHLKIQSRFLGSSNRRISHYGTSTLLGSNILNKLPKSQQAKAKQMIHNIYMASTREEAESSWKNLSWLILLNILRLQNAY